MAGCDRNSFDLGQYLTRMDTLFLWDSSSTTGAVKDWHIHAAEQVLTTFPTQIVNAKGEMKGSAITGPVGKEAAELWPVSISHSIPPSRTKSINSVS